MSLQIPSPLKSQLESNAVLNGGVLLSIAHFEPWLAVSTVPFFPDYTDHGLTHISDVLETASFLITNDSWPIITAGDAAVLVISVLLHDCAMHLTEDGFVALIDPGRDFPCVPGFDEQPWPVLWHNFLAEARRFDGRTLIALFGDSSPIKPPPLDSMELTLRDRQLIGEFLRRHHSRLAHEIAINGVPGPDNNHMRLAGLPPEVVDLAGLVARSHGIALRTCLPYLREHYDTREFQGIHAVYLMALLRVSDYLQVQAGRAPGAVLKVKRLRSPTSIGEWNAHSAIRDIRYTHDDPEAVFIDALPSTIKEYIRVQEWLMGIQYELDVSWAVLGEIYSPVPRLGGLGIKLRRVRSNFEEKRFPNTIPFVPVKAAFEAADAELLKLLIIPLYGARPNVGVRELLQNAVDAVRELNEYLAARPDLRTKVDWTHPADISISVAEEEGEWWITISDRGIGMRVDTVTQFFLRAGASYRRSQEWAERFTDGDSHSKVLRSGRFGIGALAAFLLGDEIHVLTRHIDEPVEAGIEFSATIDSEAIEIRRVELPVGTTVRIKLHERSAERLSLAEKHAQVGNDSESWDWYCLSSPLVIRSLRGDVLEQRYQLPTLGEELPYSWHQIFPPQFSEVHWTYDDSTPPLVCNGIDVRKFADGHFYGYNVPLLWSVASSYTTSHRGYPYGLITPHVSVYDPDGFLPLNLQRTEVVDGELPFSKDLTDSVVYDFLAYLLVNGPTSPLVSSEDVETYAYFRYKGISISPHVVRDRLARTPLFSTHEGFGFGDSWNVEQILDSPLVLFPFRGEEDFIPGIKLPSKFAVFPEPLESGEAAFRSWIRYALGYYAVGYGESNRLRIAANLVGRRLLLPAVDADRINKPKELAAELRAQIVEEHRENGWVVWRLGTCPSACINFLGVFSKPPKPVSVYERAQVVAEWHFSEQISNNPDPNLTLSPVAQIWKSIIGGPLIPYDRHDRLERFGKRTELVSYVKKWETLNITKSK